MVRNRADLDLSMLNSKRVIDNVARLEGVFGQIKASTQSQRQGIEKMIGEFYGGELQRVMNPELIPYMGVLV